VVEGGRRAPALRRHPVHQGGVDPGEPLERGRLGGDVGDGVGRSPGLRLRDQGVVVAGVEEVAHGVGGGEPPPEQPPPPAIGLEPAEVVRAGAARGEQQDEGLDLLRLGVAALALAHAHVLGDRLVQAQRAHRLQDEGQPGATGDGVTGRDHLHPVRQQSLAHRGARRRGRPPGCVPRRSSMLTAVNSLMSRHARSYSAIRGATAAARSSPR